MTAEAAQLSDDITNRKQLLVKIEEKLQQAEEVRRSSKTKLIFKPNAAI